MKRVILLIVALSVFVFSGTANATLTGPRWWQIQDKPTTIAGYGLTDAASTSALTAHGEMSSGTHGIPVGGEFASASGTQNLTNKTLDDTNSIDGGAIKSGVVGETYIDTDIARDVEIPGNASFSFNLLSDAPTRVGQSLKVLRVKVGEDGYEWIDPTSTHGLTAREDITTSVASTTITLAEIEVGALNKLIISINGSIQPLACFTKTDATHIEVDTELPVGTVVSIYRFD